MSSPTLLMLDEPSLGLAPRVVAEIMARLDQLRTECLTILPVEQNARAALAIADRGYVLDTGPVVVSVSGAELLNDPRGRSGISGWCGATLHVRSRSHGRRRAFFYGCTAHHHRGSRVCRNSLQLPMLETDEALLTSLEAQLLHPEVVQRALREAVAHLSAAPALQPARIEAARAEVVRVTAQLRRLTDAVVLGGELPTLVAEMKILERRRAALQAQIQQLEHGEGVNAADLLAVEPELLVRLADWRGLFRRHVREARQMLGHLLVGRVIFTPKATGPEWEVEYAAEASLSGLVSGSLGPKAVVAPTGFEPVFAVRHALSQSDRLIARC